MKKCFLEIVRPYPEKLNKRYQIFMLCFHVIVVIMKRYKKKKKELEHYYFGMLVSMAGVGTMPLIYAHIVPNRICAKVHHTSFRLLRNHILWKSQSDL